MINISLDMLGVIGLVDDLQTRVDALGEGDIPSEWTPEHVGVRLIEAYEVMSRSGGRIGPSRYGNGWPAMVHEFADMVDAQARQLAEKEAQQLRSSRPTSDEISRMNEALAWPMSYLDGKALAADSLMLWTYATATGRDMAGMLHHRKKRATALAAEMMRRANAPARIVDGEITDTRDPAVLARNALRLATAREIAHGCNIALAKASKTTHAEIRRQAQAAFRARCRDRGCLPLNVKPIEAMPGRALARTTLDRYRKAAMALVATGLRRDGVMVR